MNSPHVKLAPFEQLWLRQLIDPAQEQVLWMGRPSKLYRYDGTIDVLLLACVWFTCLFGGLVNANPPAGWQTDWRVQLIIFVLLCTSLDIIIFPIWKRFKARHTICVLTNKRAIIQAPRILGKPKHLVYPLHPAMLRKREVHENGSGSLVFDYGWHYSGDHHYHTWPIGFLHIPNVEQVEQLIHQELIKQGQYTPQFWKEYKNHRTRKNGFVLSIVGTGLILFAILSWTLCNNVPEGWEERSVNITYAPASPSESDGAYLLQAANGVYYRVPIEATQGKYAEGEAISIMYPADNPLQARPVPVIHPLQIVAIITGIFGLSLLVWGQSMNLRTNISDNPYEKLLQGKDQKA